MRLEVLEAAKTHRGVLALGWGQKCGRFLAWTRALNTVALLLLVTGCAAPQPIEPYHTAFDADRGLLVPTRVTINRNDPVESRHLDRLDALVAALARTGAFRAFGANVSSRYVLDLTLLPLGRDSWTSLSAGAGSYRGGAGVAVPVSGGRHTHRLSAVIYRDGLSTAAFRYDGDFESEWKIMADGRLARGMPEDQLISNLVNRLIDDIEARRAIEREPLTAVSAPR